MITVADIQKDFPDWPAGVIEPWLIEFANDPDMGWPPPEPYGGHRWGRLLGQRPISWWKNVTWTLEKTDCGFDGLTPKAKPDVLDTLAGSVSVVGLSSRRKRHRAAGTLALGGMRS